jgi:hypothetical protein
LPQAANHLSFAWKKVENHDMDDQIKTLIEMIQKEAPCYGKAKVYNKTSRKRGKKKNHHITIEEIVNSPKNVPFVTPLLVIPAGKDGSVNHAVVVVDDLVFDSTQSHALKLKQETFEWICGEPGFERVYLAYHFFEPMNKTTKHERNFNKNW